MFDDPSERLPDDRWHEDSLPDENEPRFRYQLWDMLALVTSIACFMSAIRAIGWVAIALLPACLIAPSVLAHPNNTRGVKVGFVVVMLMITVVLYVRAG